MVLNTMDKIRAAARNLGRLRLTIAAADDAVVLEAVRESMELGLAEPILIGQPEGIRSAAERAGLDLSKVVTVAAEDHPTAARIAVEMVSSGEADAVLKGFMVTSTLLRAALDKEKGLRTGRLLSLTNLVEVEGSGRLLLISDPGVVVAPDLSQKVQIIANAVQIAQALGIETPRVACLAAVETVEPAMPATVEAAALAMMSRRGQIKGAMVDGPLAFDNAVSLDAARHKGIESEVAGRADILLVPSIEAGNIVYKALECYTRLRSAGLIMGAKAPIIVTSRIVPSDTKVNSIALASLVSAEAKSREGA